MLDKDSRNNIKKKRIDGKIGKHRPYGHFISSKSFNSLTWIFFPLIVSVLISIINVLYFSLYKPFISLIKFIPKYFILFDAIVNEAVLLISFSDSSY